MLFLPLIAYIPINIEIFIDQGNRYSRKWKSLNRTIDCIHYLTNVKYECAVPVRVASRIEKPYACVAAEIYSYANDGPNLLQQVEGITHQFPYRNKTELLFVQDYYINGKIKSKTFELLIHNHKELHSMKISITTNN